MTFGSAFTVTVAASVAPGDLVIVVPSGTARQAIARFDGARWESSCAAPRDARVVPLEPVRRVSADGREWRAIQATVGEIFTRREREQRIAAARLAGVAVTIDAVYASGSGQTATYYFDASKRVEDASRNADPDTDPAGVLRVRVVGWLRASPGGVTPIGSNASVEWEQLDRVAAAAAVDAVPIGTLAQGSAMVWVMKRDTSGAPTYTLYEVRAQSVRPLVRSTC